MKLLRSRISAIALFAVGLIGFDGVMPSSQLCAADPQSFSEDGTIGAVMDSKRFLSLVPGIDQGREGEQHRKNRSCESCWNPAQRSKMAYKFSSKSAPRTLHDVSLGQAKPYRPG